MVRVKSLADEIREARDSVYMTQSELARELEVSARTIQNWEAGYTPQARHMRALVAWLDSVKEAAA